MRSGTDGAAFQLMPKVFVVVEIMSLCRTFELNSNHGKPCFNEARFVQRDIVVLKQVWPQLCAFYSVPG